MDILNFTIAALALLLSFFLAWWQFLRKPNIEIVYHDDEPYRKLLIPEGRKNYDAEWFVRIKVINTNRLIAKNCFGKIIEWYTNGEKVKSFDPIKLHWVSNPPNDFSHINLSYQEFDYLDLIVTEKNQNKIKLYTNTHSRGIPIDFDLKSEHLLKVVIYCENEAYKFKYFIIWYEEKDSEGKLRFPRIRVPEKNEIKRMISAPNQAIQRN